MEEREGLSLGEIISTIFSQKWLALIIAVIITLGVTFALYFGYNSGVTYYVSTFTVSFPGGDGANPVYPDNSPFDYREIISRSNLIAAQSSDKEKFEYVNINKLYDERDISIYRTSNLLVSDQIDFSYTVRISAKYFKNRRDASDFIDALVLMPVNYLLSIASEQAGYLINYDTTDFFEDKMALLTSQIDYLISGAQDLVSNTGNSSSNIQLLNELNRYNIKLKTAIGKMRVMLYVHNIEEVRDVYMGQLPVIESELSQKRTEAEIIFGRLKEDDPTVDLIQSTERIEQLASEISKLEELKSIYSSYLNGNMQESADFSSDLVALGNELKELTDKYESYLSAFYKRYSVISYDGALEKDGELNIIVCLLIGLVAGIIIAAVLAFIVGIKKSKNAQTKTEDAPATTSNNAEQK